MSFRIVEEGVEMEVCELLEGRQSGLITGCLHGRRLAEVCVGGEGDGFGDVDEELDELEMVASGERLVPVVSLGLIAVHGNI